MTASIPARGGVLAFVLTIIGSTAGCGSSEKPTGSVSGTINYKGAPVAAGSINFISKTGAAAMAKIDASGHFKVDGALEVGEYKVYATPPLPEPAAPGAKAAAPPKFDLPAKFRDPASSGATVTVKPGANDLPIEFKD